MRKIFIVSIISIFLLVGLVSESFAADAIKVSIIQSADSISFAPVYVARYNKYFEQQGIQLDLTMARSGDIAITAQIAGDVDFSAITLSHVLKAFDAGKELLGVANIMNRMTIAIAIHKDALKEKKVTPEELQKMPVEQRVKLLKGMKLGVSGPGAMTDLIFRYLLKKAGMNAEKDVDIVPVGAAATSIAAIQKRTVDAFAYGIPVPYEPVSKGYAVILVDGSSGELPEFKNFVYEVLTVKKDYAEKNPQIVSKMAKAIAKANNFIIDQTDESAKILQTFFSKMDTEVIKRSTLAVKSALTRDALMDREGIEAHIKFSKETGFTKKDPPLEEGRFWTNKYLK